MSTDPLVIWAEHVRDHPGAWKREHTRFIDAQFVKHRAVVMRLRALPHGRETLRQLYGK